MYNENNKYNYFSYFSNHLDVIDAEALMATPFRPTRFIVEDVLPFGLTILGGPSKAGKSWLVMALCLSVSMGQPFLGHETIKSDVLYLSLEDPAQRLKERIGRLSDDCPQNFRMATNADKLGDGLEDQLSTHLDQYPETRLIVIDTLQRIRKPPDAKSGGVTYSGDYADISALKAIADKRGISIVLVHHLRKMRDHKDPFNNLSGTTGLMGAADTTIILDRQRNEDYATLYLTGRDTPDSEIVIRFEDCKWSVIGQNAINEWRRQELPPIVGTVSDFIKATGSFHGTATELLAAIGDTEFKPNQLTRLLSGQAFEALANEGVDYQSGRTNNARWIDLRLSGGEPCTEPTDLEQAGALSMIPPGW